MKVFLTIAAAFLAKEASAEAHYGLPHLLPSYGYGYYGYGPVVRPYGGVFGRRSHPAVLPLRPIGKREAEPETDSAFTYTVMAHHPKDQEMTNNRYTLLSRMDSHRRMQQRQRQQQQLMDESNMQQMDRHMQYRIMDQDQMMQQQRMGLNQQQQIVNNMLDNRRDDLQQRRRLQYSMDNNQMMMHRDNVHDMSDMRVMGMQQQQTNLNRLDMNNQRMRMNNRQQMQQYRLDNDLNQMQRMDMRLENNLDNLENNMMRMRMMTKREAEGEADGEAGYGYQTYSETPFHKSFAGAYYTPDISPIHPVPAVPAVHPVPAVPAVHPVPAVPAVFNRGYSMYSAPGVFVGHPHPAMGHPIFF